MCGALTARAEKLTPLGELLTKLPLDARLGKLIVYVYGLALSLTLTLTPTPTLPLPLLLLLTLPLT